MKREEREKGGEERRERRKREGNEKVKERREREGREKIKRGVSIKKHRQNSGKLFCPDCQIPHLYTMNILYHTLTRFLLVYYLLIQFISGLVMLEIYILGKLLTVLISDYFISLKVNI